MEDDPLDLDKAGIFQMVNVAAQRARQIMQGAAPAIQTNSRKPAAIAIQEVHRGLVDAYYPSELPDPEEEEGYAAEAAEDDQES